MPAHAHALVAAPPSSSVPREDHGNRQPRQQPPTGEVRLRIYRWDGSRYLRVTEGAAGALDVVVRVDTHGHVEATVIPQQRPSRP